MSVDLVRANIQAALRDSYVDGQEAARIVSREDPVFGRPVSIGSFLSHAEHRIIVDLYDQVKSGRVRAAPEAAAIIRQVAEGKPESRWRRILKGGSIGKVLAPTLGGIGGLGWGYLGYAIIDGATLGTGFIIGAFGFVAGAAAGWALGALQGAFDD